jgi:hypothetical protein
MFEAIGQGLRSINEGFDRLDKTAEHIARHGADGDLAGHMVEQMRARQEVRAGLAVVRTADEAIGSLLDGFA